MISVTWDKGSESGFIDQSSAQRFVNKICKATSPQLSYIIMNNTD